MKKYSKENWNKVLKMTDGAGKESQLRIIEHVIRGNISWFVRRLIALERDLLIAENNPNWVKSGYWQILEPTEFTKCRRKMEKE